MPNERTPEPNKVAIALAVMAAMREHRKDEPIAFEWPKRRRA